MSNLDDSGEDNEKAAFGNSRKELIIEAEEYGSGDQLEYDGPIDSDEDYYNESYYNYDLEGSDDSNEVFSDEDSQIEDDSLNNSPYAIAIDLK